MPGVDLTTRARRHAALADPTRLAIADELLHSDRSPAELGSLFGLRSNLLAHHLAALERAGLVRRLPSEGDRRRRYVTLDRSAAASVGIAPTVAPGPVLFICTHNSARSQLAAAVWEQVLGMPATSAGTHPAPRVHPGALAAAAGQGLDLSGTTPRPLHAVVDPPALVVTVCDRAHEELHPPPQWWHWSVPDPVGSVSPQAFEAALNDITRRITALTTEGTPQ